MPTGGAATINGIPSDTLPGISANASLYAAKSQTAAIHYNDLISGQVTVTPYANPSAAVTLPSQPALTLFLKTSAASLL